MSADSMTFVARAPFCRAEAGDGPIDVLLGHTLFMALDAKQVERMRPFPPLGTLYAAGALRAAGFRVALFDAMLAPGPEAFEQALEACQPRLVALFEDSFNYLSKMCLTRMRDAGMTMLALAGARELPCLVAGSDASDAPAPWLEAGADAVIVGEGEHSLVEAVSRLLEGSGGGSVAAKRAAGRLDAVSGLVLPGAAAGEGSGAYRRTAPRAVEARPDGLAEPQRELADIAAYARLWRAAHGQFTLNVAASRGCPFACNWCARPIWGRRYAQREAERVADELLRIAREHAPDRLWFVDDVFGLQPGWLGAFADALEQRGLRLPFQAQSRVDLLDEVYVEGLARAGCEELWLGVESGSQAILDAMQKGYQLEALRPATEGLRAAGIRVAFFLQLGYPGETWADIEATRRLLSLCKPDAIGVSVSYPLPGTPFYDRVAAELGASRHWRDSRDLAMLFEGSYETAFYRQLHRALHLEHEAILALDAARLEGGLALGVAEASLRQARALWDSLAAGEARARSPRPTLRLEADA